mgnify:CR=1 FL=1
MRSVLITGASSGIGYAAAEGFLQKGYRVYCGARRTERMAKLGEAGATVIRLDVTDEASVRQAAEQIERECGGLDVLINNAGLGIFGALEDVTINDMRRQFEVNVFGLAQVTKLFLPLIKKRRGRVINLSSAGGRMYTPLGGLYHGSKYAVEGFSNCLRYELRQFGVRVVLIEPGAVDSPWFDVMQKELRKNYDGSHYQKQIDAYCKFVGLGRRFFSKPERIAKTVVRAAETKRPRARYAVGFMARPGMLFCRLLPAKLYDGALRLLFQ